LIVRPHLQGLVASTWTSGNIVDVDNVLAAANQFGSCTAKAGKKRHGNTTRPQQVKIPKMHLCTLDKVLISAAGGYKVRGYILLHTDLISTKMVYLDSPYFNHSHREGLMLKTVPGVSDSISTAGCFDIVMNASVVFRHGVYTLSSPSFNKSYM